MVISSLVVIVVTTSPVGFLAVLACFSVARSLSPARFFCLLCYSDSLWLMPEPPVKEGLIYFLSRYRCRSQIRIQKEQMKDIRRQNRCSVVGSRLMCLM